MRSLVLLVLTGCVSPERQRGPLTHAAELAG